MEGVSKILYDWELNRPIPGRRDSKGFLREISQDAFLNILGFLLSEVITEDKDDAHLTLCLARGKAIDELISNEENYHGDCFGLIVFPSSGRIERYVLNPKSNFFSNIHQDPEIGLAYRFLQKINRNIKSHSIHFGPKGKRGEYIPNTIGGAVLLKRKINEYRGFERYLSCPTTWLSY